MNIFKRNLLTVVALLPLALASVSAKADDIVDTAIAAGQFSTLVAAVQAAGLVDTLKGEAYNSDPRLVPRCLAAHLAPGVRRLAPPARSCAAEAGSSRRPWVCTRGLDRNTTHALYCSDPPGRPGLFDGAATHAPPAGTKTAACGLTPLRCHPAHAPARRESIGGLIPAAGGWLKHAPASSGVRAP